MRPVLACLLLLCSSHVAAGEVLVAVASNFAAPMKEIAAAFETESGHKANISLGASGKFYAQISHGAPFDVFFSADQEKPAALEAAGRVVDGSRFTYAAGSLVLWSPRENFVDAEGMVLRSESFRYLALANPRLAPYGAAALELLENLSLLESTRGRWVQGENIAQTYMFVESGNAELGFVAQSQVRAGMGSMWVVPASLHAPIYQDAVLLKHAAGNTAAHALLDFIKGPIAGKIIISHGYKTYGS